VAKLNLIMRAKLANPRRLVRTNLRSRRARSEDGQAIIEAAITLPIVAAFVFVMIELCLMFYSYCMISETAREGTRYAIVHGAACQTASKASCTATASSINTYVSGVNWPNLGGGTLTPSTTFLDGNANAGSRVKVTVNYTFPVTLPFVPRGSVAMTSSSVMYFIQ
jgi:Flp pilus assembly protein TadG